MSMVNRVRALAVAAVVVAGAALLLPSIADAHGRRGGGRVVVRSHASPYFGFGYGWGPYWGSYWDPFWGQPYAYGPYAYGPREGADMNAAAIAGYGAVDLDVKPNRAEVWVDGKFVGEARDLDGSPAYLWLKDGTHRVVISKGGYVSLDTKVDVLRGIRKGLKVRLQEGAPEPARGEMGASR